MSMTKILDNSDAMDKHHHHNHTECIELSEATLELYCAEHKLKLTPLRRTVFSALLADHTAKGAYDILDRLRDAGFSAQPPLAYRALDFLVEHGFAHRIEKLNAYLACGHPGRLHNPAFFICQHCKLVQEAAADKPVSSLREEADSTGFRLTSTVIEAIGECADCQRAAS